MYHELLKPGETLSTVRYRQQMVNLNHALIEMRPEWATRHGKVILQYDYAPSHTAKGVKDTISALGWELLPHPPYSLDLAASNYHLFSSMSHALTMKHNNNSAFQSKRTVNCISIETEKMAKSFFIKKRGILLSSAQFLNLENTW